MQMKHYAKYRGQELILLGFNAADGTCLVCNVAALPVGEQQQLRMIASSVVGQSVEYLVPILQKERHPSGSDWFSYLATRLRRRDETVLKLPLKELEDMNPDQKAVFKGYKKPSETAKPTDDSFADAEMVSTTVANSAGTAPSALDKKLDALIESNAQTQQVLAQLAQLLAAQNAPAAAPAPKKRGRKPGTTTKKKVETVNAGE